MLNKTQAIFILILILVIDNHCFAVYNNWVVTYDKETKSSLWCWEFKMGDIGISDYYINRIERQEKTETIEFRKVNKNVLAYNAWVLTVTFAITSIGLLLVEIVTKGIEHYLTNFIKDSSLVNIVFSLVLSSLLEVLFNTTRKKPIENKSIIVRKEIGLFSLLASALLGFLLYSIYAIVSALNPENDIFKAAFVINIIYYIFSIFAIGFNLYAQSLLLSKRPEKRRPHRHLVRR